MRLLEIADYLKKEKLDAIVLFNKSPGFDYFIGQELEHGLLILSKTANYLFISPLYSPKVPGFKVVQWKTFKKDLESFIKQHHIKRVGFDADNILFRQKKFLSKYFSAKDASKFLSGIRAKKTTEEVIRIKQACRITDEVFTGIVNGLRKGEFKEENDIARFIKISALQNDCELSFPPIVASGGNGVIAHHVPDAKLRKGFMVLDFGVKYKGYCADMTRTIYLGAPSSAEKQVYEKLRRVQDYCIQYARVGMKASKLSKHAKTLLGKDAKYFIHGLGHGIGVEIHELPSVFDKSDDVLEKGNVFTIEPGYYNKKTRIGIRIEDDILLADNGKKEVLTKSAKSLVCIRFK